ncbi:GTP-binding protein [Devosia geojensis]|uniref:GTP-binding protein n=1 Tax=Devosia geojensis TaxID=443610 RepID=A0A0F5FNL0_9HYPH|nr:TetM/TetW/TetO/TetS family tetracycline resistance ribosomal protection protein [Devosia geojensis]KKB10431.1 GTP-binding protein [Devosia geojensis]
MRTLNLGILAHVDAGKTSLTERLLHAAGVIDEIGSGDGGNTQTDTLALEKQRGITIKAAVVSFRVGDTTVNLIDTPGHPDFIAEVERALDVLDGAVLVVSAVERVQAQTRVLFRALQRLKIPTLIFVNKIDRAGAACGETLATLAERLTPGIVPMGEVGAIGTRAADFCPFDPEDEAFRARLAEKLADHDDAILADVLEDRALSYKRLRSGLAQEVRRARLHPVFFGSAITGAGIGPLIAGLDLLPGAGHDAQGPLSGAVFKVERGPSGEKIAYARLFRGTLKARQRLVLADGSEARVTGIAAFEGGRSVETRALTAGGIGKLSGLSGIRIGDAIGRPRQRAEPRHFAPPTLETRVEPKRPAQRGALNTALAQLAEQDPFIDLRRDDLRHEIYLSLYGEVQKEVIEETLRSEFGIEATFQPSTIICVERPVGTGAAVEWAPDPFFATIGLRLEPGPIGSGIVYAEEIEYGSLPVSFHTAIEDAVRAALGQGLNGWQVTDCKVVLTHSTRLRKWATSSAADHRDLTPLVLMDALRQAGTVVCEPVHRFALTLPEESLAAVLAALARLEAVPKVPAVDGRTATLDGEIAAAHVHRLQQLLPGLTRGEGVLEAEFDHYRPVRGPAPSRPRTDYDPLNRKDYLARIRGGR